MNGIGQRRPSRPRLTAPNLMSDSHAARPSSPAVELPLLRHVTSADRNSARRGGGYVFPVKFVTSGHDGADDREWGAYICATCGGVMLASAPWDPFINEMEITSITPEARTVASEVPERPRQYLSEALRSISTPSASIMVCASAIDAMLKEKGLGDGSVYTRIKQAAEQHIITQGMADWAYHVRLEANGQRHADEGAGLPTKTDAEQCVEFAEALAEFLFVLPARVSKGLQKTSSKR